MHALLHAQNSALDLTPRATSTGFGGFTGLLGDVTTELGVSFVLLVGLLVWAKYLRKRSRRHADPHLATRVIDEEGAEEEEGRGRHRRRHKRHRRDHRTRNPTLAETGGLPPPKSSDELPPTI